MNYDEEAIYFKVRDGVVICSWFALCDKPATGVVEHPILKYVPTCDDDAAIYGLTLIPAEFQVEDPIVLMKAED